MSLRQKTLYVSGFSQRARPRDIAYEFERFGRLVRCDAPALRNNSSRPYAFIEFEDDRDARDAYNEMRDARLDGHRLSVQFAKNSPSASWRYEREGEGGRGRGGERDRHRSRSPARRGRSPPRRRSRSPEPNRDRHRPRSPQDGRRNSLTASSRSNKVGDSSGRPSRASRSRSGSPALEKNGPRRLSGSRSPARPKRSSGERKHDREDNHGRVNEDEDLRMASRSPDATERINHHQSRSTSRERSVSP
ncbi:hypothetical protein EDD11_005715 [Mortierella claussenii]|nr:hypothetical protein EDD11_005715 [Mortierella claussenii]